MKFEWACIIIGLVFHVVMQYFFWWWFIFVLILMVIVIIFNWLISYGRKKWEEEHLPDCLDCPYLLECLGLDAYANMK